jgi:uroporphyrinogen-III synthase
VIGGVIGGVVVMLVVWWQGDDEVAALRSKVAEIEGTVAASGPDQLSALAGRVDALESAGTASAQAADGDLVSRDEAVEAKAEAQGTLEARLAALESGTAAPDLTGRLAEIEAALQQLPGKDAPQVTRLEERIAKLESGAASAGPAATAASAADDPAVKALQERLASLEASLPAATAQLVTAETNLEQLSGSVNQLTQKLDADTKQSATLATEVSALATRISDTESKIESADQNRGRATALTLIVGQLEAAIDEARPYQTQVEALDAMAGSDPAVQQAVDELEPGAAAGVPRVAALRQSFAPVANDIVHAASATGGDNLIDRATDNLMRLVTVRPVGDDVRGDTVEARVARAEAALGKDDLAGAVGEIEQLDGRPAAAAAAWLEQAKARLGADQAVARLRTQATDLLRQNP